MKMAMVHIRSVLHTVFSHAWPHLLLRTILWGAGIIISISQMRNRPRRCGELPKVPPCLGHGGEETQMQAFGS